MRTPVLLVTCLMAVGCVTQSTYDALKTERDATVGDRDRALAEQSEALKRCEARAQQLDAMVKQLEADAAAKQAKVTELEARVEKLLADMALTTKDKSRLQASIDDMKRALAELEKRRAEAEARVLEFKGLLARFRTLIDAGKLTVKIHDGRMVVVLATDILFASGSASLSKEGKAAIAEVSQVLSSIPKRSFQVEGHTDNVPIATGQYPSNWELGAARAISVLKAMVEAGMQAERISAASFAHTRPVAPNDSPERKAQNRRIDIVIVPDLSTLPGFEELQRAEKGG